MSIDEKVVVRSGVEAMTAQPSLALLDELLTPKSVHHPAPLAGGTDSEDERQVERTLRSAIYGLPGR